jgi:hypothetical protein
MELVYLDQNALIKLGFKTLGDAQFREKLNGVQKKGYTRARLLTFEEFVKRFEE